MTYLNPSTILFAASILSLGNNLQGTPAANDASGKAQVQALVDKCVEALNAKNVHAFGSVFAADGEFTNPVGMSVQGRTAIEQFHAALFSENNRPSFAHAHLSSLGTSIRFIRPDVAAVDIKWEQSGAIAPDGSPWGTRRGVLSWVVTRDNGVWQVKVWHNMELPTNSKP